MPSVMPVGMPMDILMAVFCMEFGVNSLAANAPPNADISQAKPERKK